MIPRYQTKEMQEVWSYDNKISCWLKVEAEAIRAMGGYDVIPFREAEELYRFFARYEELNMMSVLAGRVQFKEEETKHDLAAFVDVISSDAEDMDLDSRWIHYGLTSSDIVDTAFTMQIKDAIRIIDSERLKLIEKLIQLVNEHRDTVMMGRTHGMHAEPTTFGVICSRWSKDLNEVLCHLDRQTNWLYGK
jgi:adenylosuccinate lyase